MTNKLLGTLALLAVGCTPTASLLDDPTFATGSRTMVANAGKSALINVNVDEGTISRVSLDGTDVQKLAVGSEPTRIARAGDRLYVTLRGERAVAVVQEGPAGLDVVGRIEVGAEPVGVVANEEGSRVFVAVSLEDRVVAIDTATQEITSSWVVPNEPRWLALHPSGKVLAVAGARNATLATIEVDGGETVEVHALPETERTTVEGVITLTPRLMGDPSFDPQGVNLVLPAMYVDNQSQQDVPVGADPTMAYYTNPRPGIGRFNAAVVQVPVSVGGQLEEADAKPVFLSGFKEDYFSGMQIVRSYPNSVTVSPDGWQYAVSMEASDAVVMLGALDYDRGASDDWWVAPAREEDPVNHGFADHPMATIEVGQGPRGVVFTDERQAYVHTFLDLVVTDLNVRSAMERVEKRGVAGLDDIETDSNAFATLWPVEESVLPVEVQRGRRLFFSATEPELVATSSGVSCSTCHTDGRDDGLTWQLGPNRRQTPSLAGRVSDTHPVTWTGNVSDVATEAELTSTIRMGGQALSRSDYEKMAAFIDWTREVDHPARGASSDLVAQGQAIFEREDVGCASCHSGPAFTDNGHHDMYGLSQVNTPTLRGIAATGPYLHDGSADTIREVLEFSRNRTMGDTSMLTDAEMDALEAYVRSL